MPWEIAVLCASGDTVDVTMFIALHTTISTSGLYDLLELKDVQDSWKQAIRKTAELMAQGQH